MVEQVVMLHSNAWSSSNVFEPAIALIKRQSSGSDYIALSCPIEQFAQYV